MGMRVSTKGRYALRVMVDLVEHNNGSYVSLNSVAMRQELSEKYLEAIISAFSKAGYVKGQRGKGGGYKLNVDPEKFTVWDVLTIVEGDLAPVSCLGDDPINCKMKPTCKTLPMWEEFYALTKKYFKSVTVAELAAKDISGADYSI